MIVLIVAIATIAATKKRNKNKNQNNNKKKNSWAIVALSGFHSIIPIAETLSLQSLQSDRPDCYRVVSI